MDIKVPAVGESIKEATIGEWKKASGDYVKRDEVILVLETDKASVEVVAEQEGQLKIKAAQGAVVPIGSVVGEITPGSAPQASASSAAKTQPPPPPSASASAAPTNATRPAPPKTSPGVATDLSPSVRRIVAEKNIDPATLSGTGKGGRLTKVDVEGLPAQTSNGAQALSRNGASSVSSATVATLPATERRTQHGTRRVPMTTIRKRIAQRLVEAQNTAAILTTFNEVDMSAVMHVREKYKDKFKERYGVSLGFMGFFTKACIEGLKAVPEVNAVIEGTDIVYRDYYHVGVAVGTEKGLIVPVLRDVDTMSIAEVELGIKHFATKARDGKITVDDLSGGTFTISNGGVYGSLMSTPILNFPQSGILGMHKIEDRAVVIDKKVEVRPMMYVALSYDHRIIDGKEAVTFLVKVKECIEDPQRILLEI